MSAITDTVEAWKSRLSGPGTIPRPSRGIAAERLLRANSPRADPCATPLAGSRGHGSAIALHGYEESTGGPARVLLRSGRQQRGWLSPHRRVEKL